MKIWLQKILLELDVIRSYVCESSFVFISLRGRARHAWANANEEEASDSFTTITKVKNMIFYMESGWPRDTKTKSSEKHTVFMSVYNQDCTSDEVKLSVFFFYYCKPKWQSITFVGY